MASSHSPKSDFGYTSRSGTTSRRQHEDHGLERSRENAEEKAKKDALLEEKIKAIKKKNEDLIKRQQEIEEDKRNANKLSDQVIKSERRSGGVRMDRNEPKGFGRARGRVLAKLSGERLKAAEWEERRRQNIARVEEEQRNPLKPSSSEFLLDDRRVDMSKVTGRTERSWGWQDFHNVRKQMERDKARQHRGEANPEIRMTGKERRDYLEWKEERRKIDEERKERAKRSGDWSREWDRSKMYDPKKKSWIDDEGDEVSDRSYNPNSRRREKTRLGDWMGQHDNKEHRSYDLEDNHNKGERRSDRQGSSSSDGWNEGSNRHDSRSNQRRSRVDKTGSFSSQEKEPQPTCDEWDKTSEEGQTQAQKKENQPFVLPITEEWDECIIVETKNYSANGHGTLSNDPLREEHHFPISESGDQSAKDSEETIITESEDINCLPTNSDQKATKLEVVNSGHQTMENSRELFENLTVSTLADGGRYVVASPEKDISKVGTVATETKEQQAPKEIEGQLQKETQSTSAGQFDDADGELVKHNDDRPKSPLSSALKVAELTGSSSDLTATDAALEHQSVQQLTESQLDDTHSATSNINTSAIGHPILSEEEANHIPKKLHDKKHPAPLHVSHGRKSSQEENVSKDGPTVPTTPDFLKPTYNDPNPKLDWGEYMEEIEEEPT